jgi:hypothetical protein
MTAKQVLEETRHREPTFQEELAVLGDDDLFDMANLTAEETGIEGVVFISTAVGAHGPRVKYFVKAGKGQPSFSMSIAEAPQVLASSFPDRVVNQKAPQVSQWILLNREALLSFWSDGQYWTTAQVRVFLSGLRKLP